ncbi:hypothetical protein M9H77_17853 [Catharanthus roseus]|uniref:Uncharacterized protein n=1 Tax=Catharanthus roseus TaxID=4058 RepID=A0ACC0B5S0_CATRO|nr:hypothetical protein M9H77_17853 [Catharanthus roseus]
MGCVELASFAEKYNDNLVKEFYANLSKDFGNTESPTYSQVYVRGHINDFSPANIAHYLSCPYFSDIEGTSLVRKLILIRDLFSLLTLGVRELDPLAMLKIVAPSVVPLLPTSSTPGRIGSRRSARMKVHETRWCLSKTMPKGDFVETCHTA